MDLGQADEAISSYTTALQINPEYTAALGNLGAVYQKQGKLEDATDCYHQAIAINPDDAEAHSKLGNVLADQRKLDEALASYQRALSIKPDHPLAQKNYLYTLLYHPKTTNEELFEALRHSHQPERSDRPKQSPPRPAAALSTGQRLRIGYLTSDFRDHPLGRNIMPLLSHHDHDRFEIFCYAEMRADDDVTEQFRGHADHWRVINGMTDAEVAANIRDDGIQIMVFLGGNFDKNRPSIAGHRAAPVQVSMHSGTTTALYEMDFWMTDAVLHPPGTVSERFTEDLCRLGNFYVYPAPENAPDVSPLPADKNSFITFASFNKPCKMNDQVLDLWSKVLLAVPDSRLMLKFKNFMQTSTVNRDMLERFAVNGVAADRISMISAQDNLHDHLANYHHADIALDTFPFAGATTTFQALWMGLPVISLMGERFISRAGGSISTIARLGDLVADTPHGFIDIAAALAGDWERLKDLRATMRDRINQSPICDGAGYTATLEEAYQSMSTSTQKVME